MLLNKNFLSVGCVVFAEGLCVSVCVCAQFCHRAGCNCTTRRRVHLLEARPPRVSHRKVPSSVNFGARFVRPGISRIPAGEGGEGGCLGDLPFGFGSRGEGRACGVLF